MADVFISYSRKDIAFARLLHQALKESELETWIDWQDIPPSADWLAEVYEAIEGADSFVFIISPTAVESEVCEKEIAHAVRNNKRLIPIVIDRIDPQTVPDPLASLNWIFFEEAETAFGSAVQDLITAVRTDQAWVKEHTRLQTRALEWERRGKERAYLLRGGDLREAEGWLSQSAHKDPNPTALQTEYILASRSDSVRRQRITMGAIIAGLILAVGLGIVAWLQRNVAVQERDQRATAQAVAIHEANTRATAEWEAISEAEARSTAESAAIAESDARATAQAEAEEQRDEAQHQANISLSRALSMQSLEQQSIQPDLALLLSVEAYRLDDNLQSRGSLMSMLQRNEGIGRRFLHNHERGVVSIDFGPSGRYLVSGGESDDILLWDVALGQPIGAPVENQPVSGVWSNIGGVAFHPDGGMVAASSGGSVVLWDVTPQGLANARALQGPRGDGDGLAFSPDGGKLISSGPTGTILIRDLRSGELIGGPRRGHAKAVEAIAFDPDGDLFATASADDAVVLWNAKSGTPLRQLSSATANQDGLNFTGSRSLAFSPDGSLVAAGMADGKVKVWNIPSGIPYSEPVQQHGKRVFSVAFSPDGRMLASGSYDDTVIIWDLMKGEPLAPPFTDHKDFVFSVAFSPSGNTMASASVDGDIILWEIARDQLPKQHSGEVISLAFSPDGSLLASSGTDGSIRFWDPGRFQATGAPISDLTTDQLELAFGPDGDVLASICDGLCLWDVGSRTLQDRWATPASDGITCFAFSPDGHIVATGHRSGMIRLWDAATGRLLPATLQAHDSDVLDLRFAPGGDRVYSVDRFDDEIRIWDLITYESRLVTLEKGTYPGYFREFSTDASRLATSSGGGSYWNEVLIYDPDSGRALFEPLMGHTDSVTELAFNTQGLLLASGSIDHTIRLWDVTTSQPLGSPLNGYSGTISALAFSPDGAWLASASGEDPIRLWPMDPQIWMDRACRIANRNLTVAEWKAFIGDLSYQETCPDLD